MINDNLTVIILKSSNDLIVQNIFDAMQYNIVYTIIDYNIIYSNINPYNLIFLFTDQTCRFVNSIYYDKNKFIHLIKTSYKQRDILKK